jgi:hypothetical protein
VEVMMPCFSRRFIRKAVRTFTLNISTWGLEYAFQACREASDRCYIVDAVEAEHLKPIDTAKGRFYSHLRSLGCDPMADYARMVHQYPLSREPSADPHGHVFRWPLPTPFNIALFRLCERWKHRRKLRQALSVWTKLSGAGRFLAAR